MRALQEGGNGAVCPWQAVVSFSVGTGTCLVRPGLLVVYCFSSRMSVASSKVNKALIPKGLTSQFGLPSGSEVSSPLLKRTQLKYFYPLEISLYLLLKLELKP